jgi:hypothetical protein
MHNPRSEVTYPNFSRISASVNVERFLLQMQERQLLCASRAYMGDNWRLPQNVDIADRHLKRRPVVVSIPDTDEPEESTED